MLRFVRARGVRFLSDVTAVSDVTADFTNLFDGFVPPRVVLNDVDPSVSQYQ